MSAVEDFLEANHNYAENFAKGDKPLPPAKQVAVVACMDARIETGPTGTNVADLYLRLR